MILGFAILSVIFYSTKIVNWGLAEVFVTIKGTLIIIGTYFIQSQSIDDFTILAGIVVGIFSSLVLYVASIPDHDIDKEKGRRTLIIIFGKTNAVVIHKLIKNNKRNTLTWYAIDYGFIPVKIEQYRKNSLKFTVTLEEVKK